MGNSNHDRWTASIFNVALTRGTQHILYNSVSAQTLRLSDKQLDAVESHLDEIRRTGSSDDHEMLGCLVDLGFVVPEGHDEYEAERQKYLAVRSSKRKLLLTIAPTMACNLRCSYCFQQELPRSRTMPADIRSGLIEFIDRNLDGVELLAVQWFGGEPLLAYQAIRELTQAFQALCADRSIAYTAEVLTNGTLLTPNIVKSLPELSIGAVQIPLDGDPESYAERKGISLKRAVGYYTTILGSVRSILDAIGNVTIRINVDRDNAEGARSVVALFKREGLFDNRIDFRLGFLNTSRGMVGCIPHNCFSYREFGDLENEFRHFLAEEGYSVFGMPEPLEYPCMAPRKASYAIDPLGRIGKCVPAIGSEQSVFTRIYPGNIERTLREAEREEIPYSDFDPFVAARCEGCRLLPVCLGSCPKMHEPDGAFSCGMKEGLAEKLAFYSEFHERILRS